MTSTPIRVVVADDQPVVRSGLSAMLAVYDRIELVGQAANGEEAIEICAKLKPDVILMDLVMPGMPAAEAISRISEENPRTKVIALTSYSDAELVRSVLKAGAISYLLKDVTAESLADAIRTATLGESMLSPEARHALLDQPQPRPPAGHDLSRREREVLQLLIEGLHNRQIGVRLGISPATAKFHVSNILTKLGTESRTQAVAIALAENLANRLGDNLSLRRVRKPANQP